MPLDAYLTDPAGSTVLDMSDLATKSVTPRLNLPGTARFRIPSQHLPDDIEDGGYRVKVKLDGAMLHNGLVWAGDFDGDEDACYTEFTTIEPTVLYGDRPARDADGDYTKPTFLTDFATGPQIIEALHDASVAFEGFLPFTIGTVATGGADLSGAPVDWPKMIEEIRGTLVQTGQLDTVFVPVDGGASMGVLDLYNGNFGTDLTGSVTFDYQTGAYNVRRIRRQWSAADVVNKLEYLLGPRVLTSSDPAGDQHWRGKITGDGMPDGAGGSTPLPNPPGGDLGVSSPLSDLILQSRTLQGVRMAIRIFDGDSETALANLYGRLWQTESLLRAFPRKLLAITPVRGTEATSSSRLGEFHIGDLVRVNAGTKVHGGFSADVRVYAYTVSEDEDGVVAVDSLVTSADQEAV